MDRLYAHEWVYEDVYDLCEFAGEFTTRGHNAMKRRLFLLFLLLPASAFAVGGNGSTCDPSVAEWATCTKGPPPSSLTHNIKQTIHIPGGTLATPYQASTSNTHYILDSNITAAGSGITIVANYLWIDLNGHTITYAVSAQGEGINVNDYGHHDIAVTNGTIIQSTANLGAITSVSIASATTSGFTVGDSCNLFDRFANTITSATITSVASSGVVTGVSTMPSGTGHVVGDVITIMDGITSTFTNVTVSSIDGIGNVTGLNYNPSGSSYQVGDVLTLTDGYKNGTSAQAGSASATATVTSIDTGGAITGLSLTTPGKGYEVTWAVGHGIGPSGYQGPVTGGHGTGAAINVTGTISEGDQYGRGSAPVTDNFGPNGFGVANYYIANIYSKIYGRDIGGIVLGYKNPFVEQCTVEDHYHALGSVKNRDMNEAAIATLGATPTVRNCTVVASRFKGIVHGAAANIYDNFVSTNTIATNGVAISGDPVNSNIYNNTVHARGQHAVCYMYYATPSPSTPNIPSPCTAHVYNNYGDAQTTELGAEYGASYLKSPTAIVEGNGAIGFRTTWGGHGLLVENNEFHIWTFANYTGVYTPTGGTAHILSRGRGMMLGLYLPNEIATFQNNTIFVLDYDGTNPYSYGISCAPNTSPGLFVLNNTITSNVVGVTFAEAYGACGAYPLFQGNKFIQVNGYANYVVYNRDDQQDYFATQVRVVDSTYSGGGSAMSYKLLNPLQSSQAMTIYFGHYDSMKGYTYSYDLDNANATSRSVITTNYSSTITLPYINPSSYNGGPVL